MLLLEQGVYAGYLGSIEDFGVGDVIGPLDVQDVYKITKVKDVQMLLLSRVVALRLSAIRTHVL